MLVAVVPLQLGSRIEMRATLPAFEVVVLHELRSSGIWPAPCAMVDASTLESNRKARRGRADNYVEFRYGLGSSTARARYEAQL